MADELSGSDSFALLSDGEVEVAEEAEAARLGTIPWANPDHPLYFPTANDDAARRNALLQLMSVEGLSHILGDLTFRTATVPLSMNDVRAITELQHTQMVPSGEEVRGGTVVGLGSARNLAERIDTAMQDAGLGASAFVRLSTRSPKDVPLRRDPWRARVVDRLCRNERLRAWLKDPAEQLQRPCADAPRLALSDAAVATVMREGLRELRVSSGEDALRLIAASPKLHLDLMCALEQEQPKVNRDDELTAAVNDDDDAATPPSPDQSMAAESGGGASGIAICLREWCDADPLSELRVFVSRLQRPPARTDDDGDGGAADGGLGLLRAAVPPALGAPAVATAMCPWHHYIDFSKLAGHGFPCAAFADRSARDKIRRGVARLVDTVEQRLAEASREANGNTSAEHACALLQTSYVLDVVIVPSVDGGDGEEEDASLFRVVEMNGFHPAVTAAKAFDWVEDAELLCFGAAPTVSTTTTTATTTTMTTMTTTALPSAITSSTVTRSAVKTTTTTETTTTTVPLPVFRLGSVDRKPSEGFGAPSLEQRLMQCTAVDLSDVESVLEAATSLCECKSAE